MNREPKTETLSHHDIQPLLREVKTGLQNLYGERLAKLVLYGSFARGEASPHSDIDLLLVLRGEVDEWEEIKRSSEVTYPLELEYTEAIARLPVSVTEYETASTSFLRSVRRDGIEL